jgi:hypothetical protein
MLVADHTPIRSVAWQPNTRWWFTGTAEHLDAAQQQQQQASSSSSSNEASSQLFITASNNGSIKVWDIHDVLQACQERVVTRHAVNAALWLGPPHVWVTASADGSIRCFWVDAAVQATSIPQQTADGTCRVRCRQHYLHAEVKLTGHAVVGTFCTSKNSTHHVRVLFVLAFQNQGPLCLCISHSSALAVPTPSTHDPQGCRSPLPCVLCCCVVQCQAAVAMCGACLPVCPCRVLHMWLMVGWWA